MAISERKMFEIWRQREDIKKKITDLQGKIKKRDQALLAEFERRGITSLTDAESGDTITYTQAESVVYDSDELVKRLRRSPQGRAILNRCEKTVLDMKAISAEVQAGNIKPDIIAACSAIKKAAPYLRGGTGHAD